MSERCAPKSIVPHHTRPWAMPASWVNVAPFGVPVVPDVYRMSLTSPGEQRGTIGSPAPTASARPAEGRGQEAEPPTARIDRSAGRPSAMAVTAPANSGVVTSTTAPECRSW
nr:hypothetical protein [Baekduia soli]